MERPPDRPRREEYADQTRAAVLEAARRLFAENGYFQTKVEQIARLSRVSPATVYAQCGGKQGLLRSLMDSWTQAPTVVESLQESLAAGDAALVMQTLSTAYFQITKQWGDVIRVVIDVAPHDSESAAVLATAQKRHNRNLTAICRHLEDIGALRDDVDARLATRIITYYYGIDGLLRTRDVFGWSLERSNEWLLAHASAAVLRRLLRTESDLNGGHAGGMSTPQPFHIDIPQADLDDLASRLALTRWPDELPDAGWDYGVARDRVRELAAYWRQGYDWHAQAARLNAIPQFTTVIDGQQIHFLHVRGGAGLPLLLCHGWPSTPADFLELIGPLAGAGFDLVIPSMPGYGFSGPTTSPGWGVPRIARAYAELMARLGYDRYGAHGGDWGARIVPELARIDQQHVAGIHLHGFVAFPAGDPGELTAVEQQRLGRLQRWQAERGGYAAIQGSRPQTLAYAMADSPAGLLGWYLEWFDDYGEHVGAIGNDQILTNVATYWLTGTAGSAARLYKEAAANWAARPGYCEVPTALAVFPGDATIRKFAETQHNVARWTEFERGGHFAALLTPDLLERDLREFFTGLR